MSSQASTLVILILSLLSSVANATWAPGESKPHIIFILADDLGYNDISWNNPDVISPTMQSLVDSGVKLSQFYVQPSCSPSRAALLTGLYPIHNGFNGGALGWAKKSGLESQFATIAEKLKANLGYSTHMVGKWHLGACNASYLPQNRGFDTFRGIWHSGTDHYTYLTDEGPSAYDLHYNDGIDLANNGTYSSVLYGNSAEEIITSHNPEDPLFLYVALQNIHSPLQAPQEHLDLYKGNGLTGARKKALAMVSAIDDTVAQIKAALEANNMIDNSIIIFASDNGGQPMRGGANNLPLRGGKNSWFEGGLKVPAFMYSPLFDGLISPGSENGCLFHVTDFYTTLLRLAGSTETLEVDGMDQWETLLSGSCTRTSILHNIVTNKKGSVTSAAYREDQYKIIVGNPGDLTGWYNADDTEVTGENTTLYLFNIADDPEETNNLANNSEYESVISDLQAKISDYATGVFSFSTSGTCTSAQVLDSNGHWKTGCCNI